MSLLKVLENLISDEIVNDCNVKETAKMVDLDIAYKLLVVEEYVHTKDEDVERFSNIPAVTRAQKRSDGKYEIRFKTESGPDFRIFTEADAKIMRSRFLLLKGFYMTNFNKLTLPKQNEVAAEYDIGYIPNP